MGSALGRFLTGRSGRPRDLEAVPLTKDMSTPSAICKYANNRESDEKSATAVTSADVANIKKCIRKGDINGVREFLRKKTLGCGNDVAECDCKSCEDARELILFSIRIGKANFSILHHAAWILKWNAADLIDYLIVKGKQPSDGRDVKGRTPLHSAASLIISYSVIGRFIKHGARPDVQDESGHLPLHDACENDCLERGLDKHENLFSGILPLLSDKGALLQSLSKQWRYGKLKYSPLSYAAAKGHFRIVDQLINLGVVSDCLEVLITHTDPYGRTALHYAAHSHDIRVVRGLLNVTSSSRLAKKVFAPAVASTVRTFKFETPLNASSRQGFAEMTWLALEVADRFDSTFASFIYRHKACIDMGCKFKMSPLEVAVVGNHIDVVRVLLQWLKLDSEKRSVLRAGLLTAVDCGNDQALELIVSCANELPSSVKRDWLFPAFHRAACLSRRHAVFMLYSKLPHLSADAMNIIRREERFQPDTIFRRLLMRMPLAALSFLDDWTCKEGEISRDSREFAFSFDYACIEDSYSKGKGNVRDIWQPDGLLEGDAELWTTDRLTLQSTHPLALLADHDSTGELLSHPLILSLLQHKWKAFARRYYYSGLFLYMAFVLSLSAYVLNVRIDRRANSTNAAFAPILCVNFSPWSVTVYYVYWFLVLANMAKEFSQLASRGLVDYTFEFTNWIELFVFIGSAVLVGSLGLGCRELGLKWQLGIFVMLLAWLNLLSFLWRGGIHIVMFFEILKTFARVSLLLIVCLASFSLVLRMLMTNRPEFTGWNTIVKTFVMATGEVDYTDTFYGDVMHYQEAAYIVYVVFLCCITIVLMNLLVGLAVGDVNDVREQAKVRKIRMLVNLILEMEGVDRFAQTWLPAKWRGSNVICKQEIRARKPSKFRQKMKTWSENAKAYRLMRQKKYTKGIHALLTELPNRHSPRAWIGAAALRIYDLIRPMVEWLLVPAELSDISIKNAYLDRIDIKRQQPTGYENICENIVWKETPPERQQQHSAGVETTDQGCQTTNDSCTQYPQSVAAETTAAQTQSAGSSDADVMQNFASKTEISIRDIKQDLEDLKREFSDMRSDRQVTNETLGRIMTRIEAIG